MDKKPTDSEIVKGLECCSTYKGKCTDCPAFVKVDRSNCKKVLLGAVEIINRLQAKLDEAEDTIQFADKELKKANTEIERLKYCNETNISSIATLHERLKTAKAEAIKEFAEKASKLICDNTYPDFDKDGKAVNIWSAKDGYKQIDNLLKEMEGDNDE